LGSDNFTTMARPLELPAGDAHLRETYSLRRAARSVGAKLVSHHALVVTYATMSQRSIYPQPRGVALRIYPTRPLNGTVVAIAVDGVGPGPRSNSVRRSIWTICSLLRPICRGGTIEICFEDCAGCDFFSYTYQDDSLIYSCQKIN
jgi:hypothetical protein